MIVASIPITFKSGRAADLLGHMTETGREYEFVPDITLPEGCTAVIEIVKPDGTFVIDACTISSGNIIVTLPAQALAVRGMAHYIIRITTADDKIIFSAAGSIWVDDALITNELLESISEVYGLTFPDDFLTSADLANYVTIDDLRAALSDYALKSEIIDVVANPSGAAAADLSKIKIGSDIYKIPDPLDHYSTDEHIVGTWLDGSTLYEKTIKKQNISSASSSTVLISSSELTGMNIIEIGGSYVSKTSNSTYAINVYINSSTIIATWLAEDNIYYWLYWGASDTYDAYITIRYTKTAAS